MKEKSYSSLKLACQRNNIFMVTKFLKNSVVDLMYEEGLFFNIAISHDNSSLLNILLDYMYDTKQINPDPKDNNTAQSIKYNELQSVLRQCKKEYKISSEIESIIENICYEHTDEEDSMEFIDYKEDLKQENLSYIFEDNSTRESPDRELAGNEQVTILEDFH